MSADGNSLHSFPQDALRAAPEEFLYLARTHERTGCT